MSKRAIKTKHASPKLPVSVPTEPRFPAWFIALVLFGVTLALFWPATRLGFSSLDDPEFVSENPHVQSGLSWETIQWAFCNTQQAAYWAPLMWLSHLLAWQVFGANAWGHHLINVLLHAANTALVFVVFQRMTRATWRSAVLAALFGLHPLRVESVAWITERKDVLSTCFWMLTLWAYARYTEAARIRNPDTGRWYGAALVFLALGLMSKAMLVTVPCVLLLLDYWPLGRFRTANSWSLVKEKIPFFVVASAGGAMTLLAQTSGGAVASMAGLPLGARVGNALVSYCRYLEKLFWPTDLAVFYPHPGYWPTTTVLLAGGVLVGLTLLVWRHRKRHPCLLVGWLWFGGTLVPVIQLVQSGQQAMADRFTYVPCLGVWIAVVWGVFELTRGWRQQSAGLSVAALAAIIACIRLTQHQLGYWQNNETLFRHAIEVTSNNYLAHKALGDALLKRDEAGAAIQQYEEALRLDPGYADAHYNLGVVLLKHGQTDEAIREFEEAIHLAPDDSKAHNDLGTAFLRQGLADDAIREFQEAIRLSPDATEARYNLANTLRNQGRINEAIVQYQEVIQLQPGDPEAHNNLGTALGMAGRLPAAIREFEEAIRLNPQSLYARNNLGNALAMAGRTNEAMHQFQEVIRLHPNDAPALNGLGRLWLEQGENLDQARTLFEQAVQLAPGNPAILGNLGWTWYQQRHPQQALDCLLQAVGHASAPDPTLYDHLGDVYAALHRPDQAAEAWRRSLAAKPDPQVQHKLDALSAH